MALNKLESKYGKIDIIKKLLEADDIKELNKIKNIINQTG